MIQLSTLPTAGAFTGARPAGFLLGTAGDFALALADLAGAPGRVAAPAAPPGGIAAAAVTDIARRQAIAGGGKGLPVARAVVASAGLPAVDALFDENMPPDPDRVPAADSQEAPVPAPGAVMTEASAQPVVTTPAIVAIPDARAPDAVAAPARTARTTTVRPSAKPPAAPFPATAEPVDALSPALPTPPATTAVPSREGSTPPAVTVERAPAPGETAVPAPAPAALPAAAPPLARPAGAARDASSDRGAPSDTVAIPHRPASKSAGVRAPAPPECALPVADTASAAPAAVASAADGPPAYPAIRPHAAMSTGPSGPGPAASGQAPPAGAAPVAAAAATPAGDRLPTRAAIPPQAAVSRGVDGPAPVAARRALPVGDAAPVVPAVAVAPAVERSATHAATSPRAAPSTDPAVAPAAATPPSPVATPIVVAAAAAPAGVTPADISTALPAPAAPGATLAAAPPPRAISVYHARPGDAFTTSVTVTVVALPTDPPPPPPPLQPAAQAFAAAMFAAADPVGDRADAPADDLPFGLIAAAAPTALHTPALAVQGIAPGQQPALDLTRDDWMASMIDRIETLRDENGGVRETRMKLAPEALGSVEVSVRRDDQGVMQVRIAADTPQARALLADAAPRLAEMAEARGVKLGGASVESHAGTADHGRREAPAPAPVRRPAPSAAADDATGTATDSRLA